MTPHPLTRLALITLNLVLATLVVRHALVAELEHRDRGHTLPRQSDAELDAEWEAYREANPHLDLTTQPTWPGSSRGGGQ